MRDKGLKYIERHKLYKYKSLKNAKTIVNKADDIIPSNRYIGGYTIADEHDIRILDSSGIFDNVLTELTISIPHIYRQKPLEFLQEQKSRIIEVLLREIVEKIR